MEDLDTDILSLEESKKNDQETLNEILMKIRNLSDDIVEKALETSNQAYEEVNKEYEKLVVTEEQSKKKYGSSPFPYL